MIIYDEISDIPVPLPPPVSKAKLLSSVRLPDSWICSKEAEQSIVRVFLGHDKSQQLRGRQPGKVHLHRGQVANVP